MILKRLTQHEIFFLEILEHPVLCPAFLRIEFDPLWVHTYYQREILTGCNNFISFRAGRSAGKSETLLDKITYFAINDFFPTKILSIVTPNRVHLTPLWRKIVQWLNMHPFLRHFRGSINSQIFDIQLANGVTLDCRIAGVKGTGATVIGLHVPILVVDEAGFFPWAVWIELMPTVNTWELGYQVYVCGTPSGEREDNVLYFADEISTQYVKYRVSALENPRYTEEARVRDAEQYGGEDSDDYKRLVLGEHASPVVRLFSRDTINTGSHRIFTATLTNQDLEQDETKYLRLLEAVPRVTEPVVCGIDLGYTDPTVISMFKLLNNQWINFARISLVQIEYPKQLNFIDKLDTIYNFSFLAIDEGHAGIAVSQELTSNKYPNKDYGNRLVSVNFGVPVELGIDLDGNPLKVPTKNIAVEKLRNLLDNKKVVFAERDDKLLSELERVESLRTTMGKTIYRVRTLGGSLRGDDHVFSSLLCFAYALFLKDDFVTTEKHVRLLGARWGR